MDDETWFEPWRYTVFGRDGHRSCWDCRHVRVRNGDMARTCSAFPGKVLPAANMANLSLESDGETAADACDRYEVSEQTKAYEFLGRPQDARSEGFAEAAEDRRLTAAFRVAEDTTCFGCQGSKSCEFAWDWYNVGGDCLAEK